MRFVQTNFPDAPIVELDYVEDQRGFFARAWCKREFERNKLSSLIVQVNISLSREKGTLRGMHFQRAPNAETKLVRAIRGHIYDVIIDLRPQSTFYKQWIGVHLTAENRRALVVPEGFAHGFMTLADNTEVLYQASEFHHPEAEAGVRFDDPTFAIRWPMAATTISKKDATWPTFSG